MKTRMMTKMLLCALPVACIQQGYSMMEPNPSSYEQNKENNQDYDLMSDCITELKKAIVTKNLFEKFDKQAQTLPFAKRIQQEGQKADILGMISKIAGWILDCHKGEGAFRYINDGLVLPTTLSERGEYTLWNFEDLPQNLDISLVDLILQNVIFQIENNAEENKSETTANITKNTLKAMLQVVSQRMPNDCTALCKDLLKSSEIAFSWLEAIGLDTRSVDCDALDTLVSEVEIVNKDNMDNIFVCNNPNVNLVFVPQLEDPNDSNSHVKVKTYIPVTESNTSMTLKPFLSDDPNDVLTIHHLNNSAQNAEVWKMSEEDVNSIKIVQNINEHNESFVDFLNRAPVVLGMLYNQPQYRTLIQDICLAMQSSGIDINTLNSNLPSYMNFVISLHQLYNLVDFTDNKKKDHIGHAFQTAIGEFLQTLSNINQQNYKSLINGNDSLGYTDLVQLVTQYIWNTANELGRKELANSVYELTLATYPLNSAEFDPFVLLLDQQGNYMINGKEQVAQHFKSSQNILLGLRSDTPNTIFATAPADKEHQEESYCLFPTIRFGSERYYLTGYISQDGNITNLTKEEVEEYVNTCRNNAEEYLNRNVQGVAAVYTRAAILPLSLSDEGQVTNITFNDQMNMENNNKQNMENDEKLDNQNESKIDEENNNNIEDEENNENNIKNEKDLNKENIDVKQNGDKIDEKNNNIDENNINENNDKDEENDNNKEINIKINQEQNQDQNQKNLDLVQDENNQKDKEKENEQDKLNKIKESMLMNKSFLSNDLNDEEEINKNFKNKINQINQHLNKYANPQNTNSKYNISINNNKNYIGNNNNYTQSKNKIFLDSNQQSKNNLKFNEINMSEVEQSKQKNMYENSKKMTYTKKVSKNMSNEKDLIDDKNDKRIAVPEALKTNEEIKQILEN